MLQKALLLMDVVILVYFYFATNMLSSRLRGSHAGICSHLGNWSLPETPHCVAIHCPREKKIICSNGQTDRQNKYRIDAI